MRGRGVLVSGGAVVPPPGFAALSHPPPHSGRGITRAPYQLTRTRHPGTPA